MTPFSIRPAEFLITKFHALFSVHWENELLWYQAPSEPRTEPQRGSVSGRPSGLAATSQPECGLTCVNTNKKLLNHNKSVSARKPLPNAGGRKEAALSVISRLDLVIIV